MSCQSNSVCLTNNINPKFCGPCFDVIGNLIYHGKDDSGWVWLWYMSTLSSFYITNNITLNSQNKNEWNEGKNISYFIIDDGLAQFAYGHWKGMT